MGVIGLQKHEQDDIFRMLAIILWLGNVIFDEGDDGNSVINDENGNIGNLETMFVEYELIYLYYIYSYKLHCSYNGCRSSSIKQGIFLCYNSVKKKKNLTLI